VRSIPARKADAFGLMCIHYDQPDGDPPPRERYRNRRSSPGGGSWQSRVSAKARKKGSVRQCPQKQYRAARILTFRSAAVPQAMRCIMSREALNIFALVVGAVLPIALVIVAFIL
jgi:hypothetical protein